MDLYLIRHAEAFALGERGITEDADRPLTQDGEHQAAAVGKMLQRRGIVLDKLIASPYVRAQQTANILLHNLQPAPELLTAAALTPNAKPRKLTKYLLGIEGERFGLVGHLPHLEELAGWLIGAKKAQIDFAKTGVAHILCGETAAKGAGSLQWLVTPKWFES